MRQTFLLIVLLLTIPACNSDRFVEEGLANADRGERDALAPLRDSLVVTLRDSLQVPQETLDRMVVNLGQNCALVIDTGDPADCLSQGGTFGTCRATLMVKRDGEWAMGSMGTFGASKHPCTPLIR